MWILTDVIAGSVKLGLAIFVCQIVFGGLGY